MSRRSSTKKSFHAEHAPIFAALGDTTRLDLLSQLVGGNARSISDLAANHRLTRQAVTKHLRVLEDAGLVLSERSGREIHFTFSPEKVEAAHHYLAEVSALWDDALSRLKSFVEEPAHDALESHAPVARAKPARRKSRSLK